MLHVSHMTKAGMARELRSIMALIRRGLSLLLPDTGRYGLRAMRFVSPEGKRVFAEAA